MCVCVCVCVTHRANPSHDGPIQQVVDAGVVPRFVEFLDRFDAPSLQFEAAWALTNIASGSSDDTKVVIQHGAVAKFVQLLGSPSVEVKEQVGTRVVCVFGVSCSVVLA